MKILGIDPGTATMGFAVIEKFGSDVAAIEFGVISTSKNSAMPNRLAELGDDVRAILEKFEPEVVAVEKLFFAKNQTTAITVAQARGVVLAEAARFGVQIFEVTPPEVKLAVTGYGSADKRQVQEMVCRIFSLAEIPSPDDAADALAVAYSCNTNF